MKIRGDIDKYVQAYVLVEERIPRRILGDVLEWYGVCVTPSPGNLIRVKSEAYDSYASWCDLNYMRPVSLTAFGVTMKRKIGVTCYAERKRFYYADIAIASIVNGDRFFRKLSERAEGVAPSAKPNGVHRPMTTGGEKDFSKLGSLAEAGTPKVAAPPETSRFIRAKANIGIGLSSDDDENGDASERDLTVTIATNTPNRPRGHIAK